MGPGLKVPIPMQKPFAGVHTPNLLTSFLPAWVTKAFSMRVLISFRVPTKIPTVVFTLSLPPLAARPPGGCLFFPSPFIFAPHLTRLPPRSWGPPFIGWLTIFCGRDFFFRADFPRVRPPHPPSFCPEIVSDLFSPGDDFFFFLRVSGFSFAPSGSCPLLFSSFAVLFPS